MLVDGKSIVTYYCRIAWIEDGRMTDDEYTPFVFINNELSAIGWESLGGPQTRGANQADIGYDKARRAIIACRLLGLDC